VTRVPRKRKKSLLERGQAWVGFCSAAIGLVVLVVGLPHTIEDKLGRSASSSATLDAGKKAKLAATAPRLEVSYVLLENSLATSTTKRAVSKVASTILSSPVIENEILDEDRMEEAACKLRQPATDSVAFLVVENQGGRNAAQLVVDLRRLRLSGPVRVDKGRGDDYLSKLHARAAASRPERVVVPRELPPGESVRVPLWRSEATRGRSDPWCLVSRIAFEPRTVSYADPVLHNSSRIPVRRLASPEVLADGVIGLG
jgi:hypothetical protein